MAENELNQIPSVVRSLVVPESLMNRDYGHVTYTDQLKINFEEMMRIMDAKGIGFATLLEHGISASVDHQNSEHIRELRAGDEVTLSTSITEFPKELLFGHSMVRNNKDIAKQEITIFVRNMRGGRIFIPEWVSEKLRNEIA